MSVVAVVGDCATTTCLALAAEWPADDDVIVLEADPSGGSLAAWLDTPATPSLATMVAAASTSPLTGHRLDALVQSSASGVRFVAAPVRARPAHRAILEASAEVLPALAHHHRGVIIADAGHLSVSEPIAPVVRLASCLVVVHRLTAPSAAAAAVRLERLVETLETCSGIGTVLTLAIIGDEPFAPTDVADFVDTALPGAIDQMVTLADDGLCAAVLAGRTGVSPKRLRRLPLMRSAAQAALTLHAAIVPTAAPVESAS